LPPIRARGLFHTDYAGATFARESGGPALTAEFAAVEPPLSGEILVGISSRIWSGLS
jgi:hypothetical protein